MATHLLTRSDRRPGPKFALHEQIQLALGRVHEACGPARHSFALWLAGRMTGPVLWILPDWETEMLNPDGMLPFADPARFLFVRVGQKNDLLWCTEEALRANSTPLVVTVLPAPPTLTSVRRMHLAAEAGGRLGSPPLGLLLTPGEGGAQGVESRWHMTPAHAGSVRRWRLECRRARTRPPQTWSALQPRPRVGLDLTAVDLKKI